MNLFFWKKPSVQEQLYRVPFNHHRIPVEKDGHTTILTVSEIEKQFGIKYFPQLDFLAWSDFLKVNRKTARFHQKGYLDQKQLWLGTYFRKEILFPEIPPVRLRWVDEISGWGVFADQDLKPMTLIGEYAGQVRSKQRADNRNAYCFQYAIVSDENTRLTIDAKDQGGVVRFINHSSAPNLTSALATFQNLSHVVFFTNRWIKKGEQLCYDYGSSYWKKRNHPIVF